MLDEPIAVTLQVVDVLEKFGVPSKRQWRDVLGVLKVQAERLDLTHLRRWAAELAVSDLLEQALEEGLHR